MPVKDIRDLEKDKFNDRGEIKIALAVGDPAGLAAGYQYDDIQANYPDSVTETYSYFLASVLQLIITVTFTASDKSILERAQRTYGV